MAKKKAARPKPQAKPLRSRLESSLKKLQRDAEGLFGRTRKQAVRLSQDQKRALDRVVKEGQRLRTDFETRVKRTSKDLEKRSKQFLTTLEKEAEKRLEPVVSRLIGPSRQEVQSLTRRVHALEQLLKQRTPPAQPSMPAPQSSPLEVVSPSSGD